MELSENWKCRWRVSSDSVSSLRITDLSAIGPLCFIPSIKTQRLIISNPSLSPPLPPHPRLDITQFLQTPSRSSFLLPSVSSSIANSFGHNYPSTSKFLHNRLTLLQSPNHSTLAFFPTGDNFDQVGFLTLSLNDPNIEDSGQIVLSIEKFKHEIVDIRVNPIYGALDRVGYLIAWTMYSVHWFRIGIKRKKTVLEYMGSKDFKKRAIVNACWSPHFSEECVVLLSREKFIAFSMSVSDSAYFALATQSLLVLYDIRCPMIPVLQWSHGINYPCYIQVLKLSQLRSNQRDDRYMLATKSGMCIIIGSFWTCDFRLFCCGPNLKPSNVPCSSKLLKNCKSLYAWDFQSNLFLLGRGSHCENCLIREEMSKYVLPEWIDWQRKKEIVLGFSILSENPSSLPCELEEDNFGGFTLIRLMSSGKLESQKYCASWECAAKSEEPHDELPFKLKESLLYTMDDEDYMFSLRYKYLKLDYLNQHLNDSDVLRDIDMSTSIYEIASRKLWACLPMEILLLAFSTYSEFLEVIVDKKKVSLDFLAIPDQPQLPPFFLRKPSCRSNKWSRKVQRGKDLVGPVLPLPVLLILKEARKNGSLDSYSPEREIKQQCDETVETTSGSAGPSSSNIDDVVSLGDEQLHWSGGSQRPKSFFLYDLDPLLDKSSFVNSRIGNCIYKDDRYSTLFFKRPEKLHNPNSIYGMHMGEERQFDNLCPVLLKFNSGDRDLGQSDMKPYKLIMMQYSRWQDGFSLYQDFCHKSGIQNQYP